MNFGIFTLLWTSYLLKNTKCSKVIDGGEQQGVFVSDYCPKMEYCAEGAHVMCMFYNPHSHMGPRCSNARNVTITRDLANMLLEVTNAIRSKIALGKEKGKGGVILPRAYGMFKLKWDNELATFAQVLANQCVLRHDLCRATKRFPNPGQTAGLVRFSYPDWFPVSHNAQFTKPGLTMSKLSYATTQSLKSWYAQKDYVTSDMIYKYPDWEKHPDKLGGRLYLEMIHGAATHMGCGISAYAEYAYHDNNAGLNYNSVQIICNFSARPTKDSPVYTTTSPTEVDYTIRCGCPGGTEEDIDCLCSESSRTAEVTSAPKQCEGMNCKPAVVLLPIFTVEDAPVLQPRRKSLNPHSNSVSLDELDMRNTTVREDKSMEIFHAYEMHENDLENEIPNANKQTQSFYALKNILPVTESRSPLQAQTRGKLNERIQRKEVKNRYFDSRAADPSKSQKHGSNSDSYSRKNMHPKESVFSRSHTFELPSSNFYDNLKHDIRKDVAPRKDFSRSQKLLDSYLYKKRKHELISPEAFNTESDSERGVLIPTYKPISDYKHVDIDSFSNLKTTDVTDTSGKNAKNFDHYLKNKFHYQDFNVTKEPIQRFDIKNSNEESDKKLMNLLDTLEQEVKHIELDMNEKEIFDAKIRKIYGTVVGKPPDLLNPKVKSVRNDNVRSNDYFKYTDDNDLGKRVMDKGVYESEDRVKDAHSKLYGKYSDPSILPKSFRRNINSLEEEKTNKEFRQCLSIKGRKEPCLKTKKGFSTRMDDKTDKSAEELVSVHRNDPYTDIVRSVNGHDVQDLKSRRLDPYTDLVKSVNGLVKQDLKNRRVYRNEFERSTGYYDDMETRSRNKDIYDDPLTNERRKFYQEKLDKLNRKVHDARSNRRRNELEREQLSPRRYVRPTNHNTAPLKSRSKTPMSSYYIPDRARFLHGF